MRSWKFPKVGQGDEKAVLAYMQEALDNPRKGLGITAEKKGMPSVPEPLQAQLEAKGSCQPILAPCLPINNANAVSMSTRR